jgi:hypothetical protein
LLKIWKGMISERSLKFQKYLLWTNDIVIN